MIAQNPSDNLQSMADVQADRTARMIALATGTDAHADAVQEAQKALRVARQSVTGVIRSLARQYPDLATFLADVQTAKDEARAQHVAKGGKANATEKVFVCRSFLNTVSRLCRIAAAFGWGAVLSEDATDSLYAKAVRQNKGTGGAKDEDDGASQSVTEAVPARGAVDAALSEYRDALLTMDEAGALSLIKAAIKAAAKAAAKKPAVPDRKAG